MHHGNDCEELEALKLGATGRFPEGKLTEKDEGEIRIAIGFDPKSGKVIIDFGKPTAWIGFSPQQARDLASSLRKKALEAEGLA